MTAGVLRTRIVAAATSGWVRKIAAARRSAKVSIKQRSPASDSARMSFSTAP